MKTSHIIAILAGTALILSIPLIAMQFTEEVDWKLGDFIVIGTLLVGMGMAYEILSLKVRTTKYRIGLGLGLFAVLLLVWAELAVGIIGTPFAGS